MKASLRWVAALVLIAGPFIPYPAAAQVTYSQFPLRWTPGDVEIVSLEYVEGDVVLLSGHNKNQRGGWHPCIQAQAGIPIQEGFILVTGNGRAEVDFQNGSVLFLADNSALVFGELMDLSGRIHTELFLPSGTATIDVQPARTEVFRIRSASLDAITVAYPEKVYLRFENFRDGTKVTPQQDTGVTTNVIQKTQVRAGQTMTYVNGKLVGVGATDSHAPTDWDKWVASRIRARQDAIAAALKASGLSSPTPGLAYLAENGNFFPCQPYGTCWQSKEQQSESQLPNAQTSQNATGKTHFSLCSEAIVFSKSDSDTKKSIEQYETTTQYWDWALCGKGRWVYQNNHYVLVLPNKKPNEKVLHQPSVAWLRVGDKTGFVPKNPRDKRGQPPINLKYGLFVTSKEPGQPGERVSVNPSEKVKLLANAPEEFREFSSYFPPAPPPKSFLDAPRNTP